MNKKSISSIISINTSVISCDNIINWKSSNFSCLFNTQQCTNTFKYNWFNLRFYQHCEISLNAAIFGQRSTYVWPGTSTWLPDVPEKTLLHEFGHCAGMSHREESGYQGAMYPMMLYYPNEEDVASLHRDHDPWLLLRLIQPVLSVMWRAA